MVLRHLQIVKSQVLIGAEPVTIAAAEGGCGDA